MSMEISSQRLQEADARLQARQDNRPREADREVAEHFERAMNPKENQQDRRQSDSGGDGMPSPSSLMESLFGGRMSGAQSAAPPVEAMGKAGEVGELVDKLVERILVSEPGKGHPEVRITLGDGALSGTELSLSRAADGQLFVRLSCADAASFQTAVGAQDSLRSALERNGEQVRVEVAQSGTQGGNEGDTRRRSRGLDGWE